MNSAWALSRYIRCSLRTAAGHSHWWIFQTALRHRQILSAINFLRMFTNLSDLSFLNNSFPCSTINLLVFDWILENLFRRHHLIFQETLKEISLMINCLICDFVRLTIDFTINIMFFIWNKLLYIRCLSFNCEKNGVNYFFNFSFWCNI